MNADLFSTFDYGFGVTFIRISSILWVTTRIFLFLFLNVASYWHDSCRRGEGFMGFVITVSRNIIPFQVKCMGSGILFVVRIVAVFLTINIIGMGPYVFRISCHFAFAIRISFRLWFTMFLYNCICNPKVFFGAFSLPDLPLRARITIVWIEILRNFIRALTLSLRLCLNLARGQIIMGLLGSFARVIFVEGPGSSRFFCSVGCGILLVIDLFIARLQAALFVALVIIYMDELVYT